MKLVLNILERLQIDETIFVQFAIIVVLFLLLDSLLFKKVLFVLKYREKKTVGLEGEANRKMAEAEELSNKYKEKVNHAFNSSLESLKKKKSILSNEYKATLDKAQDEILEKADGEIKSFTKEISDKKASILSSSSELSKNLLDKLSQ